MFGFEGAFGQRHCGPRRSGGSVTDSQSPVDAREVAVMREVDSFYVGKSTAMSGSRQNSDASAPACPGNYLSLSPFVPLCLYCQVESNPIVPNFACLTVVSKGRRYLNPLRQARRMLPSTLLLLARRGLTLSPDRPGAAVTP